MARRPTVRRALAMLPRVSPESNQYFQVIAAQSIRAAIGGAILDASVAEVLLDVAERPDTRWFGLTLRLAAARTFAFHGQHERARAILVSAMPALERAGAWAPNYAPRLRVRGRGCMASRRCDVRARARTQCPREVARPRPRLPGGRRPMVVRCCSAPSRTRRRCPALVRRGATGARRARVGTLDRGCRPRCGRDGNTPRRRRRRRALCRVHRRGAVGAVPTPQWPPGFPASTRSKRAQPLRSER